MKFLMNLAGRNLFRNKTRTIVSITAISIAVMVVVFARGLVIGVLDSSFSLYVQYDSGHIKIIDEGYENKTELLSLKHYVDGFEGNGVLKMVDRLEEEEQVQFAIPRLKFGAMASPGEEIIRMMGWGVIPEGEFQFTKIESAFEQGRMVKMGKREIVLGSGLISSLNKKLGDNITILYKNSFDAFKGSTFKIVGVVDHYLPLINNRLFYIPLDQAQRILIMEDGATEVLIKTKSMGKAEQVKPIIQQVLTDNESRDKYLVQTWSEANPTLKLFNVAKYIYNIIYILLILLAGVVVINTMIMIVKERTQEIGMMSALGLKSREILIIFIIEGTFMGVVGSFLGAVIGSIFTKYLSIHGIDYTEAIEVVSGEFLMNPTIYPVFNFENMIFSFILGSVITALTCIIPARRAAKLEPAEALRDI
ncbi:MAG: ABC transporter permease [Halanaerobiales bacterium]|nr:ABC transporter permease [Halanaerobiales bacterium]